MADERMTDTGQAEPPGGLSITATATEGIRVLTLAGEIDHHTCDRLTQALELSGAARPRIVIDLRQVTFMDSSGLNVLILAYQGVTAADGWLRLAAPTDAVLRLLQLVGVDKLIECRPTLQEALTA
ncbi:STAS domain-containing protein [Streptomyces sp. NPDC005423]|uniref:STAS domain-containing protein n=1 Tax=Streptomyces sp. NPDC005423 TaxID=3155343 RepID=UPI0033BE8140